MHITRHSSLTRAGCSSFREPVDMAAAAYLYQTAKRCQVGLLLEDILQLLRRDGGCAKQQRQCGGPEGA